MPKYSDNTLAELNDFIERAGAFGDPTGERADLDDFVALKPSEAPTDLLLADDSVKTRVLVGRKGAGKTLYLRKLQDIAARNHSLRAEPVDPQLYLPGTEHVSKVDDWFRGMEVAQIEAVGDWFAEDILTEIWMVLWNRAILASLASRLLYEEHLLDILTAKNRSRLLRALSDLPLDLKLKNVFRTAFSFVKQFIDVVDYGMDGAKDPRGAGRKLREVLDDVLWDDLAALLQMLLEDAPPIFMYIDAIDEEFAHRPKRWLRCQKGLFYTTMRFLRAEGPLGSRMHLVISIRDIVLSSVFNSEHGTRFRSSQHIRSLSWDGSSIRAFLDRKIASLGSEWYFARHSNRPRTLSEWIGLDHVVAKNGQLEPAEVFALRHTQMLPRDIVLLGNELANKVFAVRSEGRDRLTQEEFRSVVEDVGEACGAAQMITVANQAEAEGVEEKMLKRSLEFPVQAARDEYSPGRLGKLARILKSVEHLRFGPGDLEVIRERGRSEFGCVDLPSLLWQAGLLGYTEGARDVFHRNEFVAHFSIPRGKKGYVLHPTMCECIGLSARDPLVGVF